MFSLRFVVCLCVYACSFGSRITKKLDFAGLGMQCLRVTIHC
jgi:hypothetical protein